MLNLSKMKKQWNFSFFDREKVFQNIVLKLPGE